MDEYKKKKERKREIIEAIINSGFNKSNETEMNDEIRKKFKQTLRNKRKLPI